MNRKLKIICDGDSWVFGSEILDPNTKCDWCPENDEFRIPKIFPTRLGKLMDADVINLSWPADDNGTILNRIISYITSEYINKGISTEDLLVIVGWSSPERISFWYKDDEFSFKFRLWPLNGQVDRIPQKDFWKLYVNYFWNIEEYLPRYVMNILQFQNFCDVNNIKWLCFSCFYQTPNVSPRGWEDLNIGHELSKLNLYGAQYNITGEKDRRNHKYDYLPIWNMINDRRFYRKNILNNTFKSFIENKNITPVYNGWHPSPESHKLWAEELYNYINEYNII